MDSNLNVLEYMRSLTNSESKDFNCCFLSDWTAHWLTNYCGNIKESTLSSYRSAVALHINRVLGNLKLDELTSEDVQLFINSLSLGVDIDEPLSAKSVKNIHGVLHKCLKVAVNSKYIAENPADITILPKVVRPEIQPLSQNQVNEFLNAIKGQRKELLFIVALFTGLRQAELIGLTWDCIDFENGSIYVYRQLVKDKIKGGGYKFSTLKNSKPRRIFPTKFVMQKLQEAKLCSPYTNSVFVFTNEKGEHYTHSAVYNSFIKITAKIGMTDKRFHDLRHTYAVFSLQAGVDVKTLQENMGHHSASFTLDVYGHCTDDMKRIGTEKIEHYASKNFNLK